MKCFFLSKTYLRPISSRRRNFRYLARRKSYLKISPRVCKHAKLQAISWTDTTAANVKHIICKWMIQLGKHKDTRDVCLKVANIQYDQGFSWKLLMASTPFIGWGLSKRNNGSQAESETLPFTPSHFSQLFFSPVSKNLFVFIPFFAEAPRVIT